MSFSKTSKLAVMAVLVLATSTARCLYAEDNKQIGQRYRLKVTSAGVPTLGAVMSGYKVRTRYKVLDGKKTVGEAYLGDAVYVPAPGKYTVEVNGKRRSMNFVIPEEMTRDRIMASWARQRAIELRPSRLKRRFAVPGIFVIHPTAITGKHNDNYKIYAVKDGQRSGEALTNGVAVVYAPEEIKDVDDGVLFANTLVHLLPGQYQLAINGTSYDFTLKSGESKLLRLGGLSVKGQWPGELKLSQRTESGKSAIKQPKSARYFVVAPGKYEIGQQGVVVKPGKAVEFKYDAKKLPGLRRPRLGVRAMTNPGAGVKITGFVENSPAAKAGLKVGDVILEIDGLKTNSTRELGMALKQRKFGDTAVFKVRREGRKEPIDVKISLGVEPAKPIKHKKPVKPVVKDFNEEKNVVNVPSFGFACEIQEGKSLVITKVTEAGIAAKSGLRPGDVIKGVDTAEYNPAGELSEILKTFPKAKPMKVLIRRKLADNKGYEFWSTVLKHPWTRKQVFENLGFTYKKLEDNCLTIIKVRKGSPAAKNGLQFADKIIGVEYLQNSTAAKLDNYLRQQRGSTAITLHVERVKPKSAPEGTVITNSWYAVLKLKKAKKNDAGKPEKTKRKLF